MPRRASPALVPAELIQRRILVVRGMRVLLDADLARLYGVATRDLNKAVARNLDRFPTDFAFYLNPEEANDLMFQSGTSNAPAVGGTQSPEKKRPGRGGRRKPPRVFTEQGVAMSVVIVRAFVQLREMLAGHRQLAAKLAELERRLEGHDHAIGNLFEAIRQLVEPSAPDHGRKMGFHQGNR